MTCVYIGQNPGLGGGGGGDLPTSLSYAALPAATGSGARRRVIGSAVGNPPFQEAVIYRDVEDLDGTDPLLIWLPESMAALPNLDYLRNNSGDPCKISTTSGVGSDNLAALLARGWSTDLGDGNGVIQDASGDIEIDGTAVVTADEVRLRFDDVDESSWGQNSDAECLIFIIEWDMITTDGSMSEARGFRCEYNHGLPGATGERMRQLLSANRGTVANQMGWASTGSAGQGGSGYAHSSFERMIALCNRGAGGTQPPLNWAYGPYPIGRNPWIRDSSDLTGDTQGGSNLTTGTANAGVDYVHLMTGPPNNGGQTVTRIREFHCLRYDAVQ